MLNNAIKQLLHFVMISHAVLPGIALCMCAVLFSVFAAPATAEQTPSGSPFTIVMLPDTQVYSETYPEIFEAQTSWIAAHRQSKNIAFVTHVGDIVNYPQLEKQWKAADVAMQHLDGVVPYGLAPGNHDFTRSGEPILYQKYFPISRLRQTPGETGNFGVKNSYRVFTASNQQFLAMNLEFCPTDEVLRWAGEVLSAHRRHKAIITTHSMLQGNGERSQREECEYFHHEGSNAGADIWRVLIENGKHQNIILFLSGHNMEPTAGAARRTDIVNGRPVHQILADYQHFEKGGSGFMRLLTFVPAQRKLIVETYSPYTDSYLTDAQNYFELSL